MPELPEIETVRRDLEQSIQGARIVSARASDPMIASPSVRRRLPQVARGETIEALGRCGKILAISLSSGYSVLQRFGMTGQMFPISAGEEAPSHTRMIWELEDGRRLIYRDVRRFGETLIVRTEKLDQVLGGECGLGYDALEAGIDEAELAELLAPHRIPLKNFLMDQRHLAGIGNIYASEALFRARLHPEKPASSLDQRERRALLRAVRVVLQESVEYRGTTISDYRTGDNETGAFQERLRVYGRAREKCSRRGCAGRIERIVQAQRSTFFCPLCQTLPKVST